MDLPSSLGRTATAAGATVFLVPPMAVYRESLDETRMRSEGCRYSTADVAAIRSLAAVLADGRVTSTPVYQRPDLREGVYFVFADESRLKVLLQDNFGGRLPVNGIAETSNGNDLQSVAVLAKETLATDLRRWAARYGGVGTGAACDRQVPPPDVVK